MRVVDAEVDAVLRPDGIALPRDNVGFSFRRSRDVPNNWAPLVHSMHPEWAGRGRVPVRFGFLDDLHEHRPSIKKRLRDGHHVPRVGCGQVDRHQHECGCACKAQARTTNCEDHKRQSQHDQRMHQAAHDRSVAPDRVERSRFRSARIRSECLQNRLLPDGDPYKDAKAEPDENTAGHDRSPSLAGGDRVPSRSGEDGQRERSDRKQLGRVAKLAKAR